MIMTSTSAAEFGGKRNGASSQSGSPVFLTFPAVMVELRQIKVQRIGGLEETVIFSSEKIQACSEVILLPCL